MTLPQYRHTNPHDLQVSGMQLLCLGSRFFDTAYTHSSAWPQFVLHLPACPAHSKLKTNQPAMKSQGTVLVEVTRAVACCVQCQVAPLFIANLPNPSEFQRLGSPQRSSLAFQRLKLSIED